MRPPWSIVLASLVSGFRSHLSRIFSGVRVLPSAGSFYHSGECDSGVPLGESIGGLGSANETSGSKRSSCWMAGCGIVLFRPSF